MAGPPPLLVLAAVLTTLATAAVLLRRRRWVPVGTLTALHLYPLKSGGRVALQCGTVTRLGLVNRQGTALDRCLAVVCEGKVLDARARRRLVLVSAAVGARDVTLTAPDMAPLTVALPQPGADVTTTSVDLNGHSDAGVDLGPEAASWLGRFFSDGRSYTLLFFLPGAVTPRRTAKLPKSYVHLAGPEDIMTYNFVTSLSAICEASVTELNRRLDTPPVTVERFRHNLIVGGASAFDDDSWVLVRIGGAVLRRVKPVHRCAVTLVDPATGERSAAMEPLRTLRKFRRARTAEERRLYGEAPLFGSALAVDQEGPVAVGDTVFVTRW